MHDPHTITDSDLAALLGERAELLIDGVPTAPVVPGCVEDVDALFVRLAAGEPARRKRPCGPRAGRR